MVAGVGGGDGDAGGVRGVEQRVEAAVDGGGEQHQQTQLLPHPQPGVQPEGETGVLGAPGMVENTSPYDQDRSSPTLQVLGVPGWWKIPPHMLKIDLHKPHKL